MIKNRRKKNPTKTARVDFLTAWYATTRRTDKYEPAWIPFPFNELLAGEMTNDFRHFGTDIIEAYVDPLYGFRISQGGLKVGTSTWVFMGRKDSEIIQVGDWVAVSRKSPKEAVDAGWEPIYYALYDLDSSWALYDRNAGSLKEILEIAANPEYYGVPNSGKSRIAVSPVEGVFKTDELEN